MQGMKVVGTRRSVERMIVTSDGIEIHPTTALHELLMRSSVLIITVPSTPETRGKMISYCPPTSYHGMLVAIMTSGSFVIDIP